MSLIDEVRREREDLARVLKKHLGIRKIVEELYPDNAHFLYELLQNAEDTGATEVYFTLSADRLAYEHNGRPFEIRDVEGITDIGEGTKAKDDEKIGRFGVGFKAVFAYSETPHIWSPTFSFKITELVLPSEIPEKKSLGNKTRFEFPFNNPKKTANAAYAEIKAGLDSLHEMTLLFLNNIGTIGWKIGEDKEKKISRLEHTESHIELVRSGDGTDDCKSAHYLRFKRPVAELDKQYVAIAFQLEFLPTLAEKTFKKNDPFENQFRVTSAMPGRVSVYFPAEKETSGLRFHLHAPFVPELSRASIKDTPTNIPLYRQLAELTADSLPEIRDLGLLKRELLAVLPNPQDTIPARYEHIRASIIAAMNERPLTPTHSGTHAPAKRLLQSSASFKELLTTKDIGVFVGHGNFDDWAISASQKNSNQDRFLSGLAINIFEIDKFVLLLTRGMRLWGNPTNEVFENWLKSKPDNWHQQLYALLDREADYSHTNMHDCFLVRCSQGYYAKSECCFFPVDGKYYGDELTLVEKGTYTSGNNKNQQKESRNFLESIGVREVSEAVYVENVLKKRYIKENLKPNDKDLERFVALVEDEPSAARIFADYFIFQIENDRWCKPSGIYLDKPLVDTGLSAWYTKVSGRHALHERYQHFSIKPDRLAKFAEAVGAQVKLEIKKTSCIDNPDAWNLFHSASGKRTIYEHDEDYQIEGIKSVLNHPSLDVSKLIWRTLANSNITWSKACYRRNSSYALRNSTSCLAHTLKACKWVPQGNEPIFVKPINASNTELPDGFPFDVGWPWLRDIEFGKNLVANQQNNLRQVDAEKRKLDTAKSLGFSDERSLHDGLKFAELSREERARVLAEIEKKKSIDLPDHAPKNPELRAERIVEQAKEAPERITEQRTRSVAIGKQEVTKQANEYLQHHYTNPDGVMICQVCQNELPFKLSDGSYYFEAIELLQLANRHPQNHLALCPNHAAMFKHANGSKDELLQLLKNLDGNNIAIELAGADSQIYFNTTHVIDLKAVINADTSMPTGSGGKQSGDSHEQSGDELDPSLSSVHEANSQMPRSEEQGRELISPEIRKNHPEMVQCPQCASQVRKDRLNKHLARAHSKQQNTQPLLLSGNQPPIIKPAAKPSYDNCPHCHVLLPATQLNEHIAKFHSGNKPRFTLIKRR